MKYLRKLLNKIKGTRISYIIAVLILMQLSYAGYLWGILQKDASGIRMNHEVHAKNDVKCDTCHSVSDSNTRFATFKDHKACSECHDEKIKTSDTAACKFCHTRGDNKTALRKNIQLSPLVNFDHKKHKEADVKCTQCHENGADNKKVAGNNMLPKMETCVECHKKNKVANTEECQTCHINGYENIRPLNHSPLWMKNHGKEITQDVIDRSCSVCHTKKNNNSCIDCHTKEKPSSHTMAWRTRGHAQYAQLKRESCATCHKQSECITCHKTTPPVSHTGLWGSPYNRHCINCHMEGGDYASGAVGRNCGFCHSGSSIFGKHTAKPRPAGHMNFGCANPTCHTALLKKHPYPTVGATQCQNCHR